MVLDQGTALTVVDARAGGDVSRVIVDGAPVLRGATVKEQCADFARRFDHLRLILIQPPYGALHMCPVLLLPASTTEADFGVIIMESMGYPPISGSNLFCAAAVALERGLVRLREPETSLHVETPAGIVPVSAQCRNGSCRRVTFENAPVRIKRLLRASFDTAGPVPVIVVSAGVDYAVVDAGSLGIRLRPDCSDAMIKPGLRAVAAAGTDFALFHGPIRIQEDGARCTLAVFQNPGVICRSPTGTGTSAMLALAYTRGLLAVGAPLSAVSPDGGRFVGRIRSVQDTPDGAVLRTVISGDVAVGPTRTVP